MPYDVDELVKLGRSGMSKALDEMFESSPSIPDMDDEPDLVAEQEDLGYSEHLPSENDKYVAALQPEMYVDADQIREMAYETATQIKHEYLERQPSGEFDFSDEALNDPEYRKKWSKFKIPTKSGKWISPLNDEPEPLPKHSEWEMENALKWDSHHPNPVYFGFNTAVFQYNGSDSEEADMHKARTSLYYGGDQRAAEKNLVFGGEEGYRSMCEHAKNKAKTFAPIWDERKYSPIPYVMTTDPIEENAFFAPKGHSFRWDENEESWSTKRKNLVEDIAVNQFFVNAVKDIAQERAEIIPSSRNKYKAVYLHGGVGGGKTTFGKQMAAYLGLPFCSYTAEPGQPIAEDGFFYLQRIEDGETKADMADPAYLYSYGGVLQIDEILLSDLSSNTLLQILSAGENTYTFTQCRDSRYANKTLLRHPAFFMVLTGNPPEDVASQRAEQDLPTNIATRTLSVPPNGEAFDVFSMVLDPFYSMSAQKRRLYAKSMKVPPYMTDPFVVKLIETIKMLREAKEDDIPIWKNFLESVPSARLVTRMINSGSFEEMISHFELKQDLTPEERAHFDMVFMTHIGFIWKTDDSREARNMVNREFAEFRKAYRPDPLSDEDYLTLNVGASY